MYIAISQCSRENMLFFPNRHRENNNVVKKHNIGLPNVCECVGARTRGRSSYKRGDVSYSLGIINNSDLKKPKTFLEQQDS